MERVLNRKLIDCFVELVQHQAAHSRKLGELLNRTPCTRNGNNVQRIELSQTLNNFFTNDVIGFLPKSNKSALHFVKRKHPPSELSKNLVRSVVRILQDFISSSRWVHVGNSNRQAILGRPLKAHVLHVVHELNRGAHASSLVNHQNQVGKSFLAKFDVQMSIRILKRPRQRILESKLTRGCGFNHIFDFHFQRLKLSELLTFFIGRSNLLVLLSSGSVSERNFAVWSEDRPCQSNHHWLIEMQSLLHRWAFQ